MEFAESLQTMQNQRKEILRKFKKRNLAKSESFSTFADEEPTALAIDVGKPIPILSGESARIFLERARQVEEEAKRRMNEPPTLEGLKRELTFQKFFLESEERQLQERKDKIKDLENKIKDLERQLDGKS
jgi:DNA repair exonuclease SbcCD ATPase subunit